MVLHRLVDAERPGRQLPLCHWAGAKSRQNPRPHPSVCPSVPAQGGMKTESAGPAQWGLRPSTPAESTDDIIWRSLDGRCSMFQSVASFRVGSLCDIEIPESPAVC